MQTAILVLLAFQTPDAPVTDSMPPETPEAVRFDILVKQPEVKCEAQTGEEIVVCAEKADNEQHRLHPIANAAKYEKDESKAEFSISENAKMAVEADAAGLPGGVQSNRLMVRLKLGF